MAFPKKKHHYLQASGVTHLEETRNWCNSCFIFLKLVIPTARSTWPSVPSYSPRIAAFPPNSQILYVLMSFECSGSQSNNQKYTKTCKRKNEVTNHQCQQRRENREQLIFGYRITLSPLCFILKKKQTPNQNKTINRTEKVNTSLLRTLDINKIKLLWSILMQKYFSDMTPVNLFLLPMPKILFFS